MNKTNKLNDDEQYIVRILIFLVSIYTMIFAILDFFIKDPNSKYLALSIFVTVSGMTLYWGKDFIFLRIITKVIPAIRPKRGLTDSTWVINIEYSKLNDRGQPESVMRNGNLEFFNSLVGVKIKGSKLCDSVSKSIVEEGWIADNAELTKLNGEEIITYMYKILKKGSEIACDKIGLVAVKKKVDDDKFEGEFFDISFSDDKQERRGKVSIYVDR